MVFGPSSTEEAFPFPAFGVSDINPCYRDLIGNSYWHKNPFVQAGTAGVETLQPVNDREAGFGVEEGQEFAAHAAPVAYGRVRGLEGEVLGQLLGEAALCGNVGEGNR